MTDDVAARDLLGRSDSAWAAFRHAVEARQVDGFGATTSSGWTVRAMLSHIAAWHDATCYRLYRFAATGHAQPKVEPDDDAFNARVAAETARQNDDQVLMALDRSFERLRVAVRELPPGSATAEDGWVEALVAGNTFDHYEEHLTEL